MKMIQTGAMTLALLYCLGSAAQQDEKKADISRPDIAYITLATSRQKTGIPFSGITVTDARYDTSCLGIIPVPSATRLHTLATRKSAAEEIRDFYLAAAALAPADKPVLYCFIKTLILSGHLPAPEQDGIAQPNRKQDPETNGILFMAEFYGKQADHYLPVCRFDTVITGTKRIDSYGSTYLADALTASLYKVSRFNIEKAGKQKLSQAQIDQFNTSRFSLPALSQPTVKGIYMTFTDFLNNSPATQEFRLDIDKTGDFLYIKNEKGEDRLLTELWGYCDGTDRYIYSASNFFKLQRTGNSFKVYGAKDFTGRRNLRANFGMIDMISPNSNYSKGQTRNKYYLVKNFFQLDMVSGELY